MAVGFGWRGLDRAEQRPVVRVKKALPFGRELNGNVVAIE